MCRRILIVVFLIGWLCAPVGCSSTTPPAPSAAPTSVGDKVPEKAGKPTMYTMPKSGQ